LFVEHLARITETADMDPRLFEILIAARQALRVLTGFVIIAPACDSACQIKRVEFGARMAQEMGEVPERFTFHAIWTSHLNRSNSMNVFRREPDRLGLVEVHADKLRGAQTHR
jgi:hypothetical protein